MCFCHPREGDCCKNGDLGNLYVSVILSAAKNPPCNQGDPSVLFGATLASSSYSG